MAGYWHLGYLLPETTMLSNALAYPLDLPISHKISGLLVKVQCTRGATGAGAEFIPDIVDSIVVRRNGDEEIFRAQGRTLERMGRIQTRRQLPGLRTNNAGAVEDLVFPVMFGREFKDPHYYLDTLGASTLKLIVEMSPTISAAEYATGTLKLEVMAWQYMKGSPGVHAGLIKTRELETFTTAALGTKVIDVPRKYPLYRFYVYCYEAGIADGVDITTLKVDLDNGLSIPFHAQWNELKALNRFALNIDTEERGIVKEADAATIETWTGNIESFRAILEKSYAAAADFDALFLASTAGGQATVNILIVEGSSTYADTILQTAICPIHWAAHGSGVGQIVTISFDVLKGMDYLLPSSQYSKVQLELEQGGANGKAVVMLQEVIPY